MLETPQSFTNYNNLEMNYECLIIVKIGQSAANLLEPLRYEESSTTSKSFSD